MYAANGESLTEQEFLLLKDLSNVEHTETREVLKEWKKKFEYEKMYISLWEKELITFPKKKEGCFELAFPSYKGTDFLKEYKKIDGRK